MVQLRSGSQDGGRKKGGGLQSNHESVDAVDCLTRALGMRKLNDEDGECACYGYAGFSCHDIKLSLELLSRTCRIVYVNSRCSSSGRNNFGMGAVS